MSWQHIAEQAARQRCTVILERIAKAIERHAQDADVQAAGEELQVRGRGLKRRFLSEAGLRFAGRTK